ncbi:12543_t:CDS:2, partial [Ambispora leptoticha]
RNNNQEVLDRGKLFKQLQEINPFLTNNVIDQVIEKLLDPHLENQQFLNYLRSGITIHTNGEHKIKEGIVAHTTGSGKSDTMVFLTKKLRQEYQQCTIIVITDRQELDLQLLDRFQDYEDVFFTPQEFIVITSIRDLRENLAKPNLGKIIFVLIQKFQIREFQALPTFSNSKGLFIFIDEYHRSQNLEIGEEDNLSWALEMRKTLPEAFLFGFTATPKEETYPNIIHSYSMDDALQDEVIVRIVYEIYQYLDLNKIKKNSFHLKSVLPSLQTKGEFFKKDYENFSLNNRLNSQKPKVMYIAQSIPAAREFYQYLSQDPQFQNNVCLITSAQEEKEEKDSIHQFKNTPEVNIAIVVDKLTTGFNLESLQRIYLDQKINSPHRLFQKISRVNRKHPHKDWGFVIDLADNKEVLEETLAKYVGKSGGIIKTDPPQLQPF